MSTYGSTNNDEETPLAQPRGDGGDNKAGDSAVGAVLQGPKNSFFWLVGAVQLVVFVTFVLVGDYGAPGAWSPDQYGIYKDIMAMLLLGFGMLMLFNAYSGLTAVGFTLIVTAVAMEVNFIADALFTTGLKSGSVALSTDALINAEFAAAALLIAFGALIGKVSPSQLLAVTVVGTLVFSANKHLFVLGAIGAEDVGGTIFIHEFGAYFGLAVSYVLGKPRDSTAERADKTSDVLSLIGTVLLWWYWPSFVVGTGTDNLVTMQLCVVNTVVSLIFSTMVAFAVSYKVSGYRFNPADIQNATLAGGVAIGASARLGVSPAGAALVGALAGLVSVLGYHSEFVSERFNIHDTCGVNNLHGMPSLLGGALSAYFVFANHDATFLEHGVATQWIAQLLAVAVTFLVAVVAGLLTGALVTSPLFAEREEAPAFQDVPYWETEEFTKDD